jgi:hypothetical protein
MGQHWSTGSRQDFAFLAGSQKFGCAAGGELFLRIFTIPPEDGQM